MLALTLPHADQILACAKCPCRNIPAPGAGWFSQVFIVDSEPVDWTRELFPFHTFRTSALKCRGAAAVATWKDELACRPYLREELKLLAPRAILAVGRQAATALLEPYFPFPMAALRGSWYVQVPGKDCPVRCSDPFYFFDRHPDACAILPTHISQKFGEDLAVFSEVVQKLLLRNSDC